MSELIATLVAGTGLTERDIRKIISNAPRRYKEYTIPKRTEGVRWIAQPARELKALQRVLEREYLSRLPVHNAAMAYRSGRSIRDNALAHVENGPILKMDFKDFFPSIRVADWESYCHDRGLFPDRLERHQASQILFHKSKGTGHLRLAIGAPSSPHLSNILMYEFDALLTSLAQRDYVVYTRYADDLTFSAKRTGYLTRVQASVRQAIRQIRWPRLIVNDTKTVLATRQYHRQVTGLVLTNDNKVSLGRDRKRELSAGVHYAKRGLLEKEAAAALAGQLSFANSVEPQFIHMLERKYGRDILEKLKRVPRSL